VQWFRAEAEYQRWQEQLEIKHAEFMRCVRSFGQMGKAWRSIANAQGLVGKPGHASFAKKQSALFSRLEMDCRKHYKEVGEKYFTDLPNGTTLAQRVMEFRDEEQSMVLRALKA
jgi:hypothetical protein